MSEAFSTRAEDVKDIPPVIRKIFFLGGGGEDC
jgi:hypothetical protein